MGFFINLDFDNKNCLIFRLLVDYTIHSNSSTAIFHVMVYNVESAISSIYML